MKPSARRVLRQIREGLESKTETARTAKDVIRAGKEVKRDWKLKKWYAEHIEGQYSADNAGPVVQGGVDRGEITQAQANNLALLIGFVSFKSKEDPEKVEEIRSGLEASGK